MAMWTRAGQDCELRSWTDRRTLLDLMRRRLGNAVAQIPLYRAFEGEPAIQDYLRRGSDPNAASFLQSTIAAYERGVISEEVAIEALGSETEFRRAAHRISLFLAAEALKDIPTIEPVNEIPRPVELPKRD